jgi:hypothetical protein
MWIQLTNEKDKGGQPAHLSTGRGNKGGVSAAVRELDIGRSNAQRAMMAFTAVAAAFCISMVVACSFHHRVTVLDCNASYHQPISGSKVRVRWPVGIFEHQSRRRSPCAALYERSPPSLATRRAVTFIKGSWENDEYSERQVGARDKTNPVWRHGAWCGAPSQHVAHTRQ